MLIKAVRLGYINGKSHFSLRIENFHEWRLMAHYIAWCSFHFPTK